MRREGGEGEAEETWAGAADLVIFEGASDGFQIPTQRPIPSGNGPALFAGEQSEISEWPVRRCNSSTSSLKNQPSSQFNNLTCQQLTLAQAPLWAFFFFFFFSVS